MRTALRFLHLVYRRTVPPPPGPELTFGGVALSYDAAPLTFQPA